VPTQAQRSSLLYLHEFARFSGCTPLKLALMRTTDGFAEALVDSSSVDGNELDAWLQRYQFLRSSLYGVAEPPAEYVVVRPTLYLETTIPSYLTARPSRDPLMARHQRITREWWDSRRSAFDIRISQHVLDEVEAGKPDAARRRREVLTAFHVLTSKEHSAVLSRQLATECRLPARAATDAAHIAVAAVHAIDFLLTWNCRHMANTGLLPRIMHICDRAGYTCPLICTPEKLMETHTYERGHR
jgi:hypothetical protein